MASGNTSLKAFTTQFQNPVIKLHHTDYRTSPAKYLLTSDNHPSSCPARENKSWVMTYVSLHNYEKYTSGKISLRLPRNYHHALRHYNVRKSTIVTIIYRVLEAQKRQINVTALTRLVKFFIWNES